MQIWWRKHCSMFKILLCLCAFMLVRIVVHTTVKVCKLRHGCNIPGLKHLGRENNGGGRDHSNIKNEEEITTEK